VLLMGAGAPGALTDIGIDDFMKATRHCSLHFSALAVAR
jgi:hypothetical protein